MSSTHGQFIRIDHIIGHKSSLHKFLKLEIVSNISSDHNATGLDIKIGEINVKNKNKKPNIWKVINTLLNNKEVIEEIKKELKNT